MIIVKTKKQVLGVTLTLFLGLSVGALFSFSSIADTFSKDKVPKRVVIDAGHGLPDGGTVGVSGVVEQEINLKIAKKVEEILKGDGYITVMTRSGEDSIAKDDELSIREMKVSDMKKRRELIKKSKADIFISIHMNSYPDPKVSGLRVFYSANHSESKVLAEDIQKRISEITGAKTYAVKTADRDLFLMKDPPVPAILVECGFLSNPTEEKKLADEEYQTRVAWAIADSIKSYYKNGL